jgi:hypothetical protein
MDKLVLIILFSAGWLLGNESYWGKTSCFPIR